MLFSFGTLEVIYLIVGAYFAGRYFYNLARDYALISPILSTKIRNLYRLILVAGPLTMFVAWPLVYVAIFTIAIVKPEFTDKAIERQKMLDRARSV